MNSVSSSVFGAIFLSCMAWLAFSISDVGGRILSETCNVYVVLLLNGIGITLLSGIHILYKKGLSGFITKELKWYLARGFLVGLSNTLFLVALSMKMPLMDFYAIVFTTPFFMLLFAKILLKEHLGKQRIIATIIGFGGVLFITEGCFSDFNLAYVLTLLGAPCIALNGVIVRKISQNELISLQIFYPALGMVLISLFPAIINFNPEIFTKLDFDLLFIGRIAVLVIAQLLFVKAFLIAPTTSAVIPFQYTQILWGILFGIVLFGEQPTLSSTIGSAIIICAGLYSLYHEKRGIMKKV